MTKEKEALNNKVSCTFKLTLKAEEWLEEVKLHQGSRTYQRELNKLLHTITIYLP